MNNENVLDLNTSGIVTSLKENWIDILIILAALIAFIVIVKIVSRKIRNFLDRRISEERVEIKKRTFTFNSVASNLIVIIAFIAAAVIIADELG